MTRPFSAVPRTGPVKTWNVWGPEQGQKSRLMIDSSYTQPSDPNTMRNKGFSRNAVYNFGTEEVGKYKRKGGRSKEIEYLLSVKEPVLKKRCGVGKEFDKIRVIDDQMDPYDSYHAFVKVNDYTKNISEPLFSSGLLAKGSMSNVLWKQESNPFYQKTTGSGRSQWVNGYMRLNEIVP